MRTNVVIDDELVKEAFALTGVRTKRELVHLALQELVRQRRKRDVAPLASNAASSCGPRRNRLHFPSPRVDVMDRSHAARRGADDMN